MSTSPKPCTSDRWRRPADEGSSLDGCSGLPAPVPKITASFRIAPHTAENQNQNQNQIYSLEQYTVIPTATYSFVPPRCRRGRLAAAFPRPHVSGRLAPASAWAVWPRSLPPVCSLPRVCYLSIAILSRLHTILGALTLRRRPAVTPSSAHTSLEQRSLSPGVTAPLSWLLPVRLSPLAFLHACWWLADDIEVERSASGTR